MERLSEAPWLCVPAFRRFCSEQRLSVPTGRAAPAGGGAVQAQRTDRDYFKRTCKEVFVCKPLQYIGI